MKRFWTILLILVLTLSLCACNGIFSREYTFPEGSAVLGVDVGGCNKEEAWAKLDAAAKDYALLLTVDEIAIPVSGAEIDLLCSQEAFFAAVDALKAEEAADFSKVVSFSEAKLRQILDGHLRRDVVDSTLVYEESEGIYTLTDHTEGMQWKEAALMAAAKDAVFSLTPQLTLTGMTQVLEPAHRADDPKNLEALELVNKWTGISLSYDFQSGDGNNSVTALAVPADVLRSFLDFGEDGMTPTLNAEAVDAYAATLSESYHVPGSTGSFQTTGGSTLKMTVDYYGLDVDTQALAQDILTCMQEGISETRPVPYLTNGIMDMAYGGTYIEINLTAQHLWFYKNGECLVSTDLVSGMVGAGMNTPTGVYSIYAKDTDTYLVGEDYRSYVNYWMPFYGGYGLHDATWRGSFGGEIYLYNGSHGCVNLPLGAATTIYNNSSVGTKVILYGGVSSVPPLEQKFTGCTTYDVSDDTKPFQLDIKAKFEDPKLTYKSDNTKVATVSEDGTVTIKGAGVANITVTAEKDMCYAEGTVTVRISVHTACEEGRHTMGDPVVVKKATCQPGLQETACTKCDYRKETILEPVKSHKYGEWVTVKEASCQEEGIQERICTLCEEETETAVLPKPDHQFKEGPVCVLCGTENPDYILPPEDEESSE